MSKAQALVYPSSLFKDLAAVKRRRGSLPASAAVLGTFGGKSAGKETTMFGIGTDIITISRIEKSLEKPNFLAKVYGKKEISAFASGEKLKINSLAANFAAKEAFGKALGTGVRGFELYEVEILRDDLGKPYFVLSGRAKEIVESKNLSCHVSLSHEGDKAVAFVVIE